MMNAVHDPVAPARARGESTRKKAPRRPWAQLGPRQDRWSRPEGPEGSRNGGNIHKLGFEGGQMPLIRRVPEARVHNIFRREVRRP